MQGRAPHLLRVLDSSKGQWDIAVMNFSPAQTQPLNPISHANAEPQIAKTQAPGSAGLKSEKESQEQMAQLSRGIDSAEENKGCCMWCVGAVFQGKGGTGILSAYCESQPDGCLV